MLFKPGDKVLIAGEGPYTLKYNPNSNRYPLQADNTTFTEDGRFEVNGVVRLSHYYANSSEFTILQLPTGTLITLTDGTRIYQPTSGNPIQLTPTLKELL